MINESEIAEKSGQTRLDVGLGNRCYPIHIAPGLLESVAAYVPGRLNVRKAFIITEANVAAQYCRPFKDHLDTYAHSVTELVLPPGESSKSFESYHRIQEWLFANHVDRNSIIFALGGGVVGDIAGFAAATCMRGIDYVQVPTSLLAQVDSAVGGKTAINVAAGKNMVGAFYQPLTVIADTQTLKTLPARELRCGYAEIVKYALIQDGNFLQYLQEGYSDLFNLDDKVLSYVIERSCRIKAGIVERDEYEHGMRKWLNFGHTFGHALEAACGYDERLLHGEAVAIGMVQAGWLSVKLGYLDERTYITLRDHLAAAGLPICPAEITGLRKSRIDDLIALMRHDKKATNAGLSFVLLEDIGHCEAIHDVAEDTVYEAIEETWTLWT